MRKTVEGETEPYNSHWSQIEHEVLLLPKADDSGLGKWQSCGREAWQSRVPVDGRVPFCLEFIAIISPKKGVFRLCYYCYYYKPQKGKWGFIRTEDGGLAGCYKSGTVAVSGHVSTTPEKW